MIDLWSPMPLRLFLLLLILSVLLPAAVEAAEPNTIYGRDLVIEAGKVITRDVMVVFGSVTVDGVAERDVATFGGSVRVRGEVQGSVIALGGSVDIEPAGAVKGDLICFGGMVSPETRERVTGKVVMLGSPGRLFGLGGESGQQPAGFLQSLRWPLVLLLGWLVVTLVVGLAFPGQVAVAAGELARRPLFNGLAGILGLSALCVSLAASVLLSLLIVGIPLLVICFVAGLVLKIFGMVAVFHLVGRWIAGRLSSGDLNPLLLTMLGFLVVGLLRLVPWAGQVVWLLAGVFGIGVSLTTKFGSGEHWFRLKKQAPPAGGHPSDPS